MSLRRVQRHRTSRHKGRSCSMRRLADGRGRPITTRSRRLPARVAAPRRRVTMHPHTLGLVTRMFVRREVGKVLAEVREVVQREEQVLEQVLERHRTRSPS